MRSINMKSSSAEANPVLCAVSSTSNMCITFKQHFSGIENHTNQYSVIYHFLVQWCIQVKLVLNVRGFLLGSKSAVTFVQVLVSRDQRIQQCLAQSDALVPPTANKPVTEGSSAHFAKKLNYLEGYGFYVKLELPIYML